jgi:hypothetical protein
MDPSSIRAKSSLDSAELGITVPASLPLIDSDLELRHLETVIDRILVLHCVAAVAAGFDRRRIRAWLAQEGILGALTAEEERVVAGDVNKRNSIKLLVESIWALAWAIGFVDDLDFSSYCAPTLVTLLPDLKTGERSAEFRRKAHLRTCEEVAEVLDLAYCLHWGIRQSSIDRNPSPLPVDDYVITERRRALEWLLSNAEWGEVLLDM